MTSLSRTALILAASRDYAIRCRFRGCRHPAIVWVTPFSAGSALLASPDPEVAR